MEGVKEVDEERDTKDRSGPPSCSWGDLMLVSPRT